jgi:hypothetical protein
VRIQAEPTKHLVTLDGVECRVWNAITERGSQCFIFVHRMGLRDDETTNPDDQREFDEMFVAWKPVILTRMEDEEP